MPLRKVKHRRMMETCVVRGGGAVGEGGDSAWGNKHHHLSGSLTARSRQVEKEGG